jgi:catechol 2,3-dioxygenase-like lactoylglutathione lyase family enzyme
MFGRFLEVSIATDDIAASVIFYESLGFRQLVCTDSWPHAYCVLSDGRLCIGLHRRGSPNSALSFVLPDLASHATPLQSAGFKAHTSRLTAEDFHELRLRDSGGQDIVLLEARTFSPGADHYRESLCGYFSAYTMPAPDFDAARDFWERAGFIAHEVEEDPFLHVPITGNHLSLALHRPATLAAAALVFTDTAMAEKIEVLRTRGFRFSADLPSSLVATDNALLIAPEGTQLLLMNAEY